MSEFGLPLRPMTPSEREGLGGAGPDAQIAILDEDVMVVWDPQEGLLSLLWLDDEGSPQEEVFVRAAGLVTTEERTVA